MQPKQKNGHKGKTFVALFALMLGSTTLHAAQILIVGDSWAEPIETALQTELINKGHSDVGVDATPFILLASDLSSTQGRAFLTTEIERRPDVNIVHLSIGGNDLHFLDTDFTTNWTPSMANTPAEAAILDKALADVEIIVNHIFSIRPNMKILWSSYDYKRPWEDTNRVGTPLEHNTIHAKQSELAEQLARRTPGLTYLNLEGLMQETYGFDGVQHTVYDPAYEIPPGDPSLPDINLPSPAESFIDRGHLNFSGKKILVAGQYDGFYKTALTVRVFQINQGLNDAWFNPATAGQGFLITVFPDRKEVFLAWFTYDTERPPEDVEALLGEPGHRWLTAQGPYDGDTADLTIFVTEGGIFDAAEPAAETDPAGDGTLTLEFADCTEGLVNYEITSLGISGEIPIERITPDNVALCETLASP